MTNLKNSKLFLKKKYFGNSHNRLRNKTKKQWKKFQHLREQIRPANNDTKSPALKKSNT